MPLSANRRSAPQRGAESMGGLRLTCTWGHLQQTYNTQSLKHTHANVLCLGKTFTRNRLRELFDRENAFPLVLAHDSCCHAMEQTEVILLFRLGLTHALKGAERTMLIQDKRRWCG